jgi:hypothetical protein
MIEVCSVGLCLLVAHHANRIASDQLMEESDQFRPISSQTSGECYKLCVSSDEPNHCSRATGNHGVVERHRQQASAIYISSQWRSGNKGHFVAHSIRTDERYTWQ